MNKTEQNCSYCSINVPSTVLCPSYVLKHRCKNYRWRSHDEGCYWSKILGQKSMLFSSFWRKFDMAWNIPQELRNRVEISQKHRRKDASRRRMQNYMWRSHDEGHYCGKIHERKTVWFSSFWRKLYTAWSIRMELRNRVEISQNNEQEMPADAEWALFEFIYSLAPLNNENGYSVSIAPTTRLRLTRLTIQSRRRNGPTATHSWMTLSVASLSCSDDFSGQENVTNVDPTAGTKEGWSSTLFQNCPSCLCLPTAQKPSPLLGAICHRATKNTTLVLAQYWPFIRFVLTG